MHDPDHSSEQIIGGRYALYGPIASGGMATVHFGRQLGAGGFARTVAVKRLKGEFLESHEFISTLLDEARLASRIRHPHVVATLDMVVADDEVFLVMEYVEGESLSRLLDKLHRRGERVAPKLAAGILAGVLHALHAAHEATDERGEPLGIVHRDVSPQNVLVGADGLARLLDFGIAKGKGRLQTTRAGQLKGKVGYMSPEQILGEDPDRRSDVYAAAVVLWEVLTGRRLFPASDNAGDNFNLIPKILEADIDPPSEAANIPRALDGIVMRGLNRRRDARYATAREFAVALEDTIGVCTSREIGDWLQGIVADELAERARQVMALETTSQGADRHSARHIADATVRRRQRRRLASSRDRGGREDVVDPPTELDDAETVGAGPVDAETVDVTAAAEGATLDDRDSEDLKATQVGMGRAAARAKMAAARKRRDQLHKTVPNQDSDPEELAELHSTATWRKDDLDPEAEVTTEVYARGRLQQEPSAPPAEVEEEATVSADGPRPSDFRPRGASRAPRSASVRGPASERGGLSESDDLVVPVRSNRGLAIALVVAAVLAVVAALVKMLGAR